MPARAPRSLVAIVALATSASCAADPDDSWRARAADRPPVTADVTAPTSEVSYPPNGEVQDVLAIDNNFLPQVLTVVAGTEVRWRNNGRNDHNVLPEGDPGAVEWGVLAEVFPPKGVYARVFDRTGTFTYYCSIHGTAAAGMFGVVQVVEP